MIKLIAQSSPKTGPGLIEGIGDDCAIIEGCNGRDYLVTTDALFEGIHFRRDWISPKTLGRKALSVNLSDIAAMGGRPLFYLVNIGIPKGMPKNEIELIFEGMAQIASANKVVLIGGDTCASSGGILLTITVIGEADRAKAVTRSGAHSGDTVYVTGTLGNAALGLAFLEKGVRGLEAREFIKRHDDPTPRISTGQWLCASTCASSMIDISDGLAQDLGHIAEASGVGIKIYTEALPLSENFIQAANFCGKDSLKLALTGGEDYELAFTVAGDKLGLFEKMLAVVAPTFGHKVTKVGEVCEGSGVQIIDIHGADIGLSNGGFEHKW